MKKRLLIRSFLIIFFVLANITNLVTLPFTNAKYLKEDNFAYETSMYKRNKNFVVSYANTTIDGNNVYANYTVSFNRIIMNYPGEKDKYTFYARVNNAGSAGYNTCALNVGAVNHVNYDTGVAVFEYSASNVVSTVSFVATCNVTGYNGGVPIYFRVDEQIADDASFNLGSYTATYYNYDLYATIIDHFENSSDYDSYDEGFRNLLIGYFRSNIKSLGDMYAGNQVTGLTYNIPNNDYELDSKFNGYAVSYGNYKVLNNYYKFAFSTTSNIGDVFKHYLKTYGQYDDDYINLIVRHVVDSTAADDTLDQALIDILVNNNQEVFDILKDAEPEISQIPGITYRGDVVENLVNLKYLAYNNFRIDVSSPSLLSVHYNGYIPYFGISELNSTGVSTIGGKIKIAYRTLGENTSKMYIINGTKDDNPVKVLVNMYKKTETVTREDASLDRVFNYLSVQVLEEGAEITLNKDTTTILYDETNTEIPTSSTEDIINEIGKFVYGNDYQLPNYVEDGNIVTYTLTN